MSETAEAPVLYHDTCHHKSYYMDCAEFDALHAYAGGCCQICGLPETETRRGRLCIDHLGEYGPGLVRGLLCDKCNTLMRYVDRATKYHYLPAVPDGVYGYRYNAWCLRKLMGHRGYTVSPRGRWQKIPLPPGPEPANDSEE